MVNFLQVLIEFLKTNPAVILSYNKKSNPEEIIIAFRAYVKETMDLNYAGSHSVSQAVIALDDFLKGGMLIKDNMRFLLENDILEYLAPTIAKPKLEEVNKVRRYFKRLYKRYELTRDCYLKLKPTFKEPRIIKIK